MAYAADMALRNRQSINQSIHPPTSCIYADRSRTVLPRHSQTGMRAAFKVHLWVDSEATLQRILCLFEFRVCLWGTSKASHTSDMRQKAPLKLPSVQPMRIAHLIANGRPLWGGPPFWKTLSPNQSWSFNFKWWSNCIQIREANRIFPRCLQDGILNVAQALHHICWLLRHFW